MNILYIGKEKKIEWPKNGWLCIDDEAHHPEAKIFDPKQHSFNTFKGMDYKKARKLSEVLYTISPEAQSTLTVRNGKRNMLRALLNSDRLDRVSFVSHVKGEAEEVEGLIGNILVSPVLEKVFCSDREFSFGGKRQKIIARLNRAELGEFDALVIGLFLIAHYRGQLILPDGGFYLREAHIDLIREKRLIVGVNFLAELPPRLRNSVLLFDEKIAAGATFEDAEALANQAGLTPRTIKYGDEVGFAME